jgi:phosphoglycolate phosphatase
MQHRHLGGKRVLLFDIDGTLIHCGGAGGKALRQALCEEFEVSDFCEVELQGRTDLGILNDLLELHGLEPSPVNRERLCQRYFDLLPIHLQDLYQQSTAKVLPGVDQLLTMLNEELGFVVGLMTGNMPTSARIKLQHFELWEHFELGIYGDLTDHRPHLAAPALDLVAGYCGREVVGESIVVIGDTPLDMTLARAMGARGLAVCTGGFSPSALQVAGADCVMDDLSDGQRILDWLTCH